ncbi:Uncharacterised protein [Mycobacteroides abscessus subsp. abscessus]|nr:Uncharacterised protein [Mycobacteroides abscessus subsp. abscessus]
MLVTFSVLLSSVPSWSRRSAMTEDSDWMFSIARGTTSGNPCSCVPSTLRDCATLSKSTCSKVLVAPASAACRS